ncbi:anti-sigma factor [Devosia sp.]|uniref:anti-sigma factor n=1 Tax=Devosia sp. TaxID=1871048 RepID=UPI001B244EDF|nr:anti-sigma factor [Devosia sp.]MBO9590831.1 anti-sigma factor [Devosia sp.]
MTAEEMEKVGEYVLGLLDEADRLAFEAVMSRDPAIAAAVQSLRTRFQALDETTLPLPPNPELWLRIEGQLDAKSSSTSTVVPLSRRPLKSRSWAPLAMAASLVAALVVGYLVGETSGKPRPIMIAVLIDEASATPGAIVEAFADDSVRLVPLDRFDVPEGKILQVWTLPDAATGPVSLGTFTDPTTIKLNGPDLPAPASGQLYEITLEPSPGSPTGRPTGPILVKGFAKAPI